MHRNSIWIKVLWSCKDRHIRWTFEGQFTNLGQRNETLRLNRKVKVANKTLWNISSTCPKKGKFPFTHSFKCNFKHLLNICCYGNKSQLHHKMSNCFVTVVQSNIKYVWTNPVTWHVIILQLYLFLGPIFKSMLWKNFHLVRFRNISCFGSWCLLWSPQTRLEILLESPSETPAGFSLDLGQSSTL